MLKKILTLPVYPKKAGVLGRTIFLSILFALFAVVGNAADRVKYEKTTPIFRSLANTKSILFFSLLAFVFYIAIVIVEFLAMRYSFTKKNDNRPHSARLFIICFLLIALCYIPYFVSNYPAVVTSDSNLILRQAFGVDRLYNHHPVLYTLFVMIFCRLGKMLFGSNNAGVALTALVQMFLMAATFAYTITFLAKRNFNKAFLTLMLAFFALFPMNAYFSVTIWKDIPFAALMLLLSLSLIALVEKRNSLRASSMILPAILTFAVSLLRNNALYVMPLLLILMIAAFKGKRILTLLSFGSSILAVVLITSVLFPLCNIKKSASTEYIAVPLQQTGRIVCACDIKEAERDEINRFLPIDFIKEKYNPTIVDTLKFRHGTRFGPTYDTEYFSRNKMTLAGTWAKLCAEHPLTAADAYVCLTLGYWYPENYYGPASTGVVPDAAEIEVYKSDTNISILERMVNAVYEIPIISRLWNVGLWTWLMLLFAVIAARKNGIMSLLPFVPVFGIVLTLLIATPIFAEKRYMYAVFVTLPVLLAIKDINLNTRKENSL